MITGGAGIGKTTLWEAGASLARELGCRVLIARPSGAEARLSFAALIDLFEEVDERSLTRVPGPQRSALEVALLRAAPTGIALGSHAISLGLLNSLRVLAANDRLAARGAPTTGVVVFAFVSPANVGAGGDVGSVLLIACSFRSRVPG
jgi:hypothetical protein